MQSPSSRRTDHIHAALAHDMGTLGLTHEDLNPHGSIESKRALARAQSAHIMSKKFLQRDRLKMKLQGEQERKRQLRLEKRSKKVTQWKQKTMNSPFMVNLVAETERIDEEHHMRLDDEKRREEDMSRRQLSAKQDIIIRALQEESDLDALRREKRAIVEEERRLKALLDLEKTNTRRKADRLAAQRAEKQRHTSKREFRQNENKKAITDILDREQEALRLKHNI